jgi:fibro-slime domain-containing protein
MLFHTAGVCRGALLAVCVVAAVDSGAEIIAFPGTVRDFCGDVPGACIEGRVVHPNFETRIDVSGVLTGVVERTLGADTKPRLDEAALPKPSFTGAADFDQWYRDDPRVNLGTAFAIQLSNAATGNTNVFEFSSDEFFPIDGELLGNQELRHNYHFTYELHGRFRYLGGEILNYRSDDDLWVFINGELALELAGTHNAESGSVNLDLLPGLARNSLARIDIFFAERQTTDSVLRIQTPRLVPVPEPGTLTLSALGILAALACRPRRRSRSREVRGLQDTA